MFFDHGTFLITRTVRTLTRSQSRLSVVLFETLLPYIICYPIRIYNNKTFKLLADHIYINNVLLLESMTSILLTASESNFLIADRAIQHKKCQRSYSKN